MDRISVRGKRLTTWKNNIMDISAAFVRRLWAEHPGVSSLQTNFRLIEVKEGQAQTIDASGRCLSNAVIKH
jgi:hypothetical protein